MLKAVKNLVDKFLKQDSDNTNEKSISINETADEVEQDEKDELEENERILNEDKDFFNLKEIPNDQDIRRIYPIVVRKIQKITEIYPH